MYKPVQQGDRKATVAVIVLAAVFTIIYANSAYAFKSEEEMIDENRLYVEKHINDSKEARFQNPAPVNQEPQQAPQQIIKEKQPSVQMIL